MADILIQLFKFWNIIATETNGVLLQRYILNWKKMLLEAELNSLFSPADYTSYLNTLAILSDKIYQRYKVLRKPTYRVLMESLEPLIIEREIPTRYARIQIKANIAGCRKRIDDEFIRLGGTSELYLTIIESLKDINEKNNYTSKTTGILFRLVSWLEKQKRLEIEALLEFLISINFNHPFVVEYIINNYKDVSPKGEKLEEMITRESYLIAKEQHVEYLGLHKKHELCADYPPVFVQLKNYFRMELKALNRRIKYNCYAGKYSSEFSTSLLSSNETNQKRSFQVKWPADKSDLVELAYALYVYLRKRGSKITISEIAGWLEETFRVSLSRYSHRFAEIKMRKTSRPSKFLDLLVEEFLNYVEEGDTYQP